MTHEQPRLDVTFTTAGKLGEQKNTFTNGGALTLGPDRCTWPLRDHSSAPRSDGGGGVEDRAVTGRWVGHCFLSIANFTC